jgi:hypothetical protein
LRSRRGGVKLRYPKDALSMIGTSRGRDSAARTQHRKRPSAASQKSGTRDEKRALRRRPRSLQGPSTQAACANSKSLNGTRYSCSPVRISHQSSSKLSSALLSFRIVITNSAPASRVTGGPTPTPRPSTGWAPGRSRINRGIPETPSGPSGPEANIGQARPNFNRVGYPCVGGLEAAAGSVPDAIPSAPTAAL